MKTDATASISSTHSTTAMTLANQTTATGNRAVEPSTGKTKSSPEIQDLLETSDRDADGRASRGDPSSDSNANHPRSLSVPENGGLLDWTG